VRKSESSRRFWKTVRPTPAAFAAATTRSASAAVGANGLSTTTGRPASIARSASGTCVRLGVLTTTRSRSPARSNNASAPGTISAPGWSVRAWPALLDVVITAGVSPGVAATSGAWNTRPPMPYPRMPTRKSSAMPSLNNTVA
jgi:hypothetical protein